MSKAPRKATAIKRAGRKYIVIHATVARKGDQNVTVQLVKRAGKPHHFVAEGKAVPVRYDDFWAALEAYSKRQDELGVNPTEALPQDELKAIIALDEAESSKLAQRIEGAAQ